MAWHPGASALATLGHSGKIYCWARIYRQNWSAFAPDFTELDENQVGGLQPDMAMDLRIPTQGCPSHGTPHYNGFNAASEKFHWGAQVISRGHQ